MADKEYVSVAGFVQFDPVWRGDDESLLGVTVQSLGSQELTNITIWPEFDEEVRTDIEKGDFIAVNGVLGTYTYEKDGVSREAYNVSATKLFVGKGVFKEDTREAPSKPAKKARKAGF